jgi:hypothetical protein
LNNSRSIDSVTIQGKDKLIALILECGRAVDATCLDSSVRTPRCYDFVFSMSQWFLPALAIRSTVFCEIELHPARPLLSIREAVVTVSPNNNWNRALSP